MSACRKIQDLDETTDRLASLAHALSCAGGRREAFAALANFACAQGFTDLILTIDTSAAAAKWGELRWSTLSQERLAALDAVGFDGHDPIRRFARRSLDPVVWTVTDWPGPSSSPGREIMKDLRKVSIDAGVTVAIWGRAGRIATADAFGRPDRVRALSSWDREAFHLATGMTFRALERGSIVRDGSTLTRREIEILELATRGLSTRSIARRLEIVEPTVKFHLKSIRAKLSARNTSEAISRFAALDAAAKPFDAGNGKDQSSSNMLYAASPT